VDVLVPTSFNFPHGAKVLSIGFVLFAAGTPASRSAARYPALAGAGLLAVFGSINTAIPFLLDLMRVRAALFQLFVSPASHSRLRADDLGNAHAGGGRPRHLPHHGPDRAAAGPSRALPRGGAAPVAGVVLRQPGRSLPASCPSRRAAELLGGLAPARRSLP